jgi:thioredoxin reductase
VVVAGGGAAGLSAALVLGRARRRVVVIDAGAPRNAPAAHMQGFLSRDGIPPADFLALGRREVTGYGAELVSDQVLGIEPGFLVRLAGGRTFTARRILLATGAGDELPDIPGSASGGAGISSTARTATGGKYVTSHWECSAPNPARFSTPFWCGSGPTTSSSSPTPVN